MKIEQHNQPFPPSQGHLTEHLLQRLREGERRTFERVRRRPVAAKDINQVQEERMTFGQRMADRLAALAGSWTFILTFLGLIALWVLINSVQLVIGPFDRYPFILLNLCLSLLAGLQAPVIMMSQNRQEARDRLRAENDYEVNLKAELEIAELHLKIDALRQAQWQELLELQERQLDLLEQQGALLAQIAGTRGSLDEAPS